MAAQLKRQAASDMILTARAQAAVAQSASDIQSFYEDAKALLDEAYAELEGLSADAQQRMASISEARELLAAAYEESIGKVNGRLGNAFTDISLEVPPARAAAERGAAPSPRQQGVAGEQEPAAHPAAGPDDAPEATPEERDAPEERAVRGEEPAPSGQPDTLAQFDEAFGDAGPEAVEPQAAAPDAGADETSELAAASEGDAAEGLAHEPEPEPQAAVPPAPQATEYPLDEPDCVRGPEQSGGREQVALTQEQVLSTLLSSGITYEQMVAYGIADRVAREIVSARRR